MPIREKIQIRTISEIFILDFVPDGEYIQQCLPGTFFEYRRFAAHISPRSC